MGGRAFLLASLLLSWPAAAPAQTAPYVDQLIGGDGAPLTSAGGDGGAPFDRSGAPRTLTVTALGSQTWGAAGGAAGGGNEGGIEATGEIETVNYGALAFDAILKAGGGGLFSLTERGMPFSGGWSADAGLGVTHTIESDLARRQYRFFLLPSRSPARRPPGGAVTPCGWAPMSVSRGCWKGLFFPASRRFPAWSRTRRRRRRSAATGARRSRQSASRESARRR